MSDDELVLLDFWASPFCARVKIALEEKGITNYKCHQEDLLTSKSSLLLEMNAIRKKIPILIHNGKPICESIVILEYIDEVWNNNFPNLLPIDPYDRARARFWADYNDKKFFNFIRTLWKRKAEPPDEDKQELIGMLKQLEAELGDSPFFGGNTFGFLDVVLIPNYSCFYTYQTCFKVNFEDECPKFVAWANRCMEKDNVKRYVPDQFSVYGYMMDLRNRSSNYIPLDKYTKSSSIMSNEVVLLEFWSSPYAARVKIALEEKGVTNYESRQEDLFGSKSSLLLEMNPVHKKIPVLIHNGKPISESLVIMEYIDEVWNQNSPSLLPNDAYERARARFWADYNDKTFFNALRKLWRQKGELSEEDKQEFISILNLLEAELGDSPYYGGNTFGFLDIALIPDYSWFYSYEKLSKISIEAECPKLIAWAKRCMEKDSVTHNLPDEFKLYEYVLWLKKRFGTD